ncbi:MAG: MBL fold metallo-hydrolase [Candidatus Nanoarchaeia archaeon]|nr:MBL fold metallo-hydrolase [Candidatus Haiyanarchaeum thermophilum]
MELIFLGTGGGRVVACSQKRATGGFVIKEENFQIHVDPGPGALIRCIQNHIDVSKTKYLFLSHAHFEHVAGTWEIVEAMSGGGLRKGGSILMNKSCAFGARGEEIFSPILQEYWKNFLEIKVLEAGEEIDFPEFSIKTCRAIHEDPYAIGAIFKFKSITIGYTGDTMFSKEIAESYRGCDLLILNVLRPNNFKLKMHMCTIEAIEFLKYSEVKNAILQHFGMKMLRVGPEREALFIKQATGKNVIAATDNLRVDLRKFIMQEGLGKYYEK